MSGDYSRHRFNPKRDFSALLMQQGRVTLDSDWNEAAAIAERRLRAETVDIMGRTAVPSETPDGFKISVQISGSTKKLMIGRGRIYVDGLLAENHGAAPYKFDLATVLPAGRAAGVLAEEIGSDNIDFTAQPYLPNAKPPETNGPHLAYLDVWQREVTYVEDERLLEKALGGVDTATRLQTVWQVKLLANVGAGATCATVQDSKAWQILTQPSAGRLTTRANQVTDPDDPCLLPPTAGYKGLENQLYRIEIHDGGAQGVATFKWSRENASVATNVTAIAGDTLTVMRVGRDSVLRFTAGDFVEVTDDRRELLGLSGEMRKILQVKDETREIKLSAALPADLAPSGTGTDTLAARHTRVRRWDQRGQVKDKSGNLIIDLEAAGSTGTIPVPASNVTVALEKGIEVSFDFDAGGKMHVGDYWNFAARTADASIQELTKAPPRGIHHHYCRLAIVDLSNTNPEDCRVHWPPEFDGEHCGCSVCVTAESHNGGTLTINQAIAKVKDVGGTICLDVGNYFLREPVLIDQAQSVRLVGQGWKTSLVWTGAGPAITVVNSFGVAAESLSVLVTPKLSLAADVTLGGGPAFRLRNSIGAAIKECVIVQQAVNDVGGYAIDLSGILIAAEISQNTIFSPDGIGFATLTGDDASKSALLTFGLVMRDNLIVCRDSGINLDQTSLHAGDTRITGNTVALCADDGISCTGGMMPGARIRIGENVLIAAGNGIRIGTSATGIVNNDISALDKAHHGDGIVLSAGLDRLGLMDCEIIGNRVTGMIGCAIAIEKPIRSAMIKQNVIRQTVIGIAMNADGGADVLSIETNQIYDVAIQTEAAQTSLFAVQVAGVAQLTIAGNAIRGVATAVSHTKLRVAIDILGCDSIGLKGNNIIDVGPPEAVGTTAAIQITPPFVLLEIDGNLVQRSSDVGSVASDWYALLLASASAPSNFKILQKMILLAILAKKNLLNATETGAAARAPATGPQIGIIGNNVKAWGSRVPIVFVSLPASSCTFGNNHCSIETFGTIVSLAAANIAATGNIVRGAREAPAVTLNGPSFTAVANITSRPILANGASLQGTPWEHFNIAAS